jgi:hypothetical protein
MSGNCGGKQNGHVNVSVDGNTVKVPIGVAANVCDINANVLARDFTGSEDDACEIDQETAAANNFPTPKEAVPADTTIETGAVDGATDVVGGAANAVEGATTTGN